MKEICVRRRVGLMMAQVMIVIVFLKLYTHLTAQLYQELSEVNKVRDFQVRNVLF